MQFFSRPQKKSLFGSLQGTIFIFDFQIWHLIWIATLNLNQNKCEIFLTSRYRSLTLICLKCLILLACCCSWDKYLQMTIFWMILVIFIFYIWSTGSWKKLNKIIKSRNHQVWSVRKSIPTLKLIGNNPEPSSHKMLPNQNMNLEISILKEGACIMFFCHSHSHNDISNVYLLFLS